MRIALINTARENGIYPMGLMKISSWQKSLGNQCVLFNRKLPQAGDFDEIWISTLFTFENKIQIALVKQAKEICNVVRVGGISATLMPEQFERLGAIVHRGIIPDAEEFPIDYSILARPPDYSILRTTRGCSRKCGFCAVRILEPEYFVRGDWTCDISETGKHVLFFDNNWLAKGSALVKKDIATLRELIADGRIKSVDFNQGLDARLMTDDIAKAMRGLPIKPVRFAFDGMHEDGHVQRATEMMAKHAGLKDFMNYVLYNFTDTPEDFWYRLREHSRMSEEFGIRCTAFPMRFQPILDADTGRNHVGKHWTEKKKRGFMSILNQQSINGQVSISKVKDFEYWFTDSAEKFSALLAWDRVGEYSDKKAGALRMKRMGIQ
jgi:hypothetical protein